MIPHAWYKRWGTGKHTDYEILLNKDADKTLKKNATPLYSAEQVERLCKQREAELLADVNKYLYALDYVGLIQHMKKWAEWKQP